MTRDKTLKKGVLSLLLAFLLVTANAQPDVMLEAMKTYTPAQKRLLAVSTAKFINTITQNSLDADSVQSIACRITGLPFLLPYTEGLETELSDASSLIDRNRLREATRLSAKIQGEKATPLLLALALYYLHQPGAQVSDLKEAEHFLDAAFSHCAASSNAKWTTECRFVQSDLLAQSGKISESKAILSQLAAKGQQTNNKQQTARAWLNMANLLPRRDSTGLALYKQTKELYHQVGNTGKEIEVLEDIFDCHINVDIEAMQTDLREQLALMRSNRFQHTLYAHFYMSYTLINKSRYIDGLGECRLALQNMEWSGISAVKGTFFIRMGACFETFAKWEEALVWFRKAIDSGTAETRLFWYKGVLFGSELLYRIGRPGDALSMIDSVARKFPPLTAWEKIQIISSKGMCYSRLGKTSLADSNFMELLSIARKEPSADPYGELEGTYYQIAGFYIEQRKVEKARSFLQQGKATARPGNEASAEKYALLYKIDSLEGNYRSAVKDYLIYEGQSDSAANQDQRKKMNELTTKYAAEKRDQDIKVLTQEQVAQKAELRQKKTRRNVLLGSTGLLVLIGGLFYRQFKLKQKTNKAAERKNLELQHVITEKDWLVKEVHHRVKNNLQTVICLLESQARHLQKDASKAIEISRNRIYAMSLIHQQLYQSEDATSIDMSSYLPQFIRHLEATDDTLGRIRFRLDVPPVNLGIGQAIPVALIINEAVTNAIKYAFPANRLGTISIEIRQDGAEVTLLIIDDGIGIDPALVTERPESLGLTLIRRFCEEIHGQLKITTSDGTNVTVVFPTDPLKAGTPIPASTFEQAIAS